MYKGICKQSNLSLPRSAILCLSEYFYMEKEPQALRCGDSRSGSYTIFADGGGLAVQQLVTTQASLSGIIRQTGEGLHVKPKTYLFLQHFFTRKEHQITRRREGALIMPRSR